MQKLGGKQSKLKSRKKKKGKNEMNLPQIRFEYLQNVLKRI